MRGMGVEARVLAPCDGPPPYAWVSPLGASVPTAANGSVAPVAPDPAAALRTIRVLRDERFDIVHLHEPLAPGPTWTAILASESPLVGTFHRAGESPWYRFARGPSKWAARKLALRCAVSELALKTAQEALGGQYELVWNGIDLSLLASATPWPTTGPTVLFLGRHEPRKGLEILIDAVVRYGLEARVWVAGRAGQTAQLKESTLGDPRFDWLGTITEEEKLRRLRGADVLVAPSLHGESFGMVLLEGMAAGAAVVASDIPGYANVAACLARCAAGTSRRPGRAGRRASERLGWRPGDQGDERVRPRAGHGALDGGAGQALPRVVPTSFAGLGGQVRGVKAE